MKKLIYDWKDIESQVSNICRRISMSSFKPDYVVGITRGGNVPATMISHWFDCRCEALKVSLRDNSGLGSESNLWMAEDAFGYVPAEEQPVYKSRWDISRRKNILIVDDINDSGATFAWIKQDWQSGCLPSETTAWNSVWEHNVKFVSLIENTASQFTSDYSAVEINKAEEDCWIVFPWENWWSK